MRWVGGERTCCTPQRRGGRVPGQDQGGPDLIEMSRGMICARDQRTLLGCRFESHYATFLSLPAVQLGEDEIGECFALS